MDPKPPEKTISYRVPLDGGWTSWESVTHCSVSVLLPEFRLGLKKLSIRK